MRRQPQDWPGKSIVHVSSRRLRSHHMKCTTFEPIGLLPHARCVEYDLIVMRQLLEKRQRSACGVFRSAVPDDFAKRSRSVDLLEKMLLRRIDWQKQVAMLVDRVQQNGRTSGRRSLVDGDGPRQANGDVVAPLLTLEVDG